MKIKILAFFLLGFFSSIVHAKTQARLGLSDTTNPLLLTSDLAIPSQELILEVLTESDFDQNESIFYYNTKLLGKTYSDKTVKANTEQIRLSGAVGLIAPIFRDLSLINFQAQGQKILGRALQINGDSDGRNWSAGALGMELNLSIPILIGSTALVTRLTLGYEDYLFDQDELDEYSTLSNSSHLNQSLKFANEIHLTSLTKLLGMISRNLKDYKSRPSRFSDGRSDINLPTEKIQLDRLEIESQVEFDDLSLRVMLLQQTEADLRQSALDATTTGGLISAQMTDFFGLRPLIQYSHETRKFKNFRAGNAVVQDLNTKRLDKVTSLNLKLSKSFKTFNLELDVGQNETDTNFRELKIKNQITSLNFTKDI
jgi:hypothetical protein